jgi:hypothetical protein
VLEGSGAVSALREAVVSNAETGVSEVAASPSYRMWNGLVEATTGAAVLASVRDHWTPLQFFFFRPALFGAILRGIIANMAVHRTKAMLAFGIIFLIG